MLRRLILIVIAFATAVHAQHITSTVPTGSSPLSIAVNPVTNKIYVSDSGSNTVTVVDGATNNTTTVTVGNYPDAIAVNPVTNKIYVGNDRDATVSIIDGATNNTTTLSQAGYPISIAVNQVTNKIYVVSDTAFNVMVIDGASNNTTTVPVGAYPQSVAVNTVTNKIYVTNAYDNTVTVIDGVTNSTSTIAVGQTPLGVAVNTVTNRIYVANHNGNTVTEIDGATNATTSIPTGNDPQTVVVNPITNKIYVGDFGGGSVEVIDGATNATILVSIGVSPQALAVNTVTNQIYTANDISNTVTVIDGPTNTWSGLEVGSSPIRLALNELTNKVYVTNFDSNNVSVIDGTPNAALQFVPITPCRLADTRNTTGPFGGPKMAAGTSREFDLPNAACGIPTSALAYALNVTVVPDVSLGYLTMWPSGQTQPLVSTLNSNGRVKANAAIVPAGANGGVSVYVSDSTQVILDINGYFVPAGTAQALSFFPLTPCRVADTRNPFSALGGPVMAGGQARSFPILSSNCLVPSTAKAYSLNFTAVPRLALSYLSVWPTGKAQPLVSTLNASTGVVTANAAIVPAGNGGQVSVYATDTTDVVIDINGYFAPPSTGGLSFYSMAPCRAIDTRLSPFGGAFYGLTGTAVEFGACYVDSAAQAYVFNATVVPQGGLSYFSIWPNGLPQPLVSTLNAPDGVVTSNMAIVPTSDGYVAYYASDLTQLVLDVSGYFAP